MFELFLTNTARGIQIAYAIVNSSLFSDLDSNGKGVGETGVSPWRKAGEAVGKPRGFRGCEIPSPAAMQIQSPTEGNLGFLNTHRSGEEIFNLSSGTVAVPKYFFTFKKWEGSPVPNTYNNKAIIDWNGEPVFTELAVLRLFQENGWNGVWVDSYRRKFRVGLPDVAEPVDIPPAQAHLIQTLREKTGRFGGCWDVLVWKDERMLFLELKRMKKDRIQNSQISWLETSLVLGLNSSAFRLIEWNTQ